MGIETALLGSAIIGGASSFMGGQQAAKGAKSAAKINAQQYADTKAGLAPYMDTGTNAMGVYSDSLGLNGNEAQQKYYDDFQYEPGFQRFLDDSNTNAMRSYSIYGDTGGNLANALRKNSEGAIYGQFQDRKGQLAGLATQGVNAASALARFGSQSTAQQAQDVSQAGQFAANGIIGAGQAGVNAFGNYAKSTANQNAFNAGANPWAAQTVNRASF